MSQMKELYEKVSKDNALQEAFKQILKDAEQAGQEATEDRMVCFAKDAGYNINIHEMRAFFQEYTTKEEGELSNLELDMVAGGKSATGWIMIAGSILTLGFTCVAGSMMLESVKSHQGCGGAFQ